MINSLFLRKNQSNQKGWAAVAVKRPRHANDLVSRLATAGERWLGGRQQNDTSEEQVTNTFSDFY